MNLSQPFLVVF